MRTGIFRMAAVLIIIFSVYPTASTAQDNVKTNKNRATRENQKTRLFNGKDLNNWVFQLKDPAADPASVFTVRKGVINISGNPFGYMRTKDIYSDYKLHVEWRWPAGATNSGVFVHAQEPDTIWLKCVECQLQAGNAGDFVCMNKADMNERTDKSKIVVKKIGASSEKPTGDWNAMEVVCNKNTIEVFVNGVLKNRGTGVNLSQGHICLQSEGKNIEFRNVFLTKLKK